MQTNLDGRKQKSRISRLLSAVLIAALALTMAAVSIPNLLRSRIAANEASAVGSVRTLNTALASYREQHPGEGYPQTMADLAPYVDPVLSGGLKSGYQFRYQPQAPDVDGVVRAYSSR